MEKSRSVSRIAFVCFAALTASAPLPAEELSLSVRPEYSVPVAGPADTFSGGFGASLEAAFPLAALPFSLSARFGYLAAVLKNSAGVVHVASLGAGPSFVPFRSDKLSLELGAGAGLYAAFAEGAPALVNPSLFAGAGLKLDFGSAVLGLTPGVETHWASRDGAVAPFYAGIGLGGSVSFKPGRLAQRKPLLRIEEPVLRPFFPSIYKYYGSSPVGEVRVFNGERGDIRDVRVEFLVPRYMDGPATVAEIPLLKAGEARSVPLTALLRNEVLGVTETDAVQAVVTVGYLAGDASLAAARAANLRVEGRNAVSWDDDRKAASFVTAKDPTILKLSRNALAAAGAGGAVFSEAFRKGMIAFSSLSEHGIKYTVDPASSYERLSASPGGVDYVQFPVQTLDYRTGDCDDLTVLYVSFLEALGVETAFVLTPGHIYAAFALDMTELEARGVFASTDDLVVREGKVWIPVESTALQKGFLAAWSDGARQWREAAASGKAGFVPVRAAWNVFEPTFISSAENADVVSRFPDPKRVAASFDSSMKSFTERELTRLEKDLRDRIAARSSPGLLNRLGALYARYGAYDKAEAMFQQSAREGNAMATHNLGNLRFMRRDFRGALELYERAARANPDLAEAVLGAARAQYELGQFEKAATTFKAATALDPRKAAAFSYVGGGTASVGRAADPSLRSRVSFDE